MKILALCVFALAVTAPLAAQAAAPGDPAGDQATAIRVRYDDLNLNSERDAETLLTRLDRAALAACGAPEGSLREYRAAVRDSACYERGLDRAVAAVDAPAVTGLYRQSMGLLAAN